MVFNSASYIAQVVRPAERAGRDGAAFHHPLGPTLYRKKVTRVYRKTGRIGMASVPVDLAEFMLAKGQVRHLPVSPTRVGRKIRTPSKRMLLPLHCIRYKQGSSWRYYYTVIENFPHPPDSIIWETVPRFSPAYLQQELLLDEWEPSIGWASFFDTQSMMRVESTAALRRHPDQTTGLRGRPVKSRMIHAKKARAPAAMLSLFSKVPVKMLPAQVQGDKGKMIHLQEWFAAWNSDHNMAELEAEGVMNGEMEEAVDELIDDDMVE